MPLAIVGSMAFDEILTPHGNSGKIIGGAATYAGLSASFFADKIKLISVIGNDYPKEELEYLTKNNIDYSAVQVIKDKPSFFWKGSYHVDMNNRDTLDTQLNALLEFNPQLPNSYQDCDYLLLGNLDPKIQLNVLEQFNKKPKFVALDTMNFWMDSALIELKNIIKKVDILIINDSEAKQLSNETNLVLASKKILDLGIKALIIKKGENGAMLFHQDGIFVSPALPLDKIFDPTGAGDTFAGGLMGYITRHNKFDFETLKSAIIVGSAIASFCIEKFGIQRLKEITKNDIIQRIETFSKLTNYKIDI